MGLRNRHQKHLTHSARVTSKGLPPRNGKQRGLNWVIVANANAWHSRIAHNGAFAGRYGDVGIGARSMLFIEQPDFVWGLISSLYTANFAAVAVNIALIPSLFGRCACRLPSFVRWWWCCASWWVCAIAKDARCVVDLCLWRGGICCARRLSIGPLVLALVLGPLMEKSFRQTLIAEQGNILAFVERPLSATFIGLAILFFVMPFAVAFHRRERAPACSQQTSKN